MRWDRKVRARLAKIVWERSVEIDTQIRSSSRILDIYMDERDRGLPAHFAILGFSVAGASEWSCDACYNHPTLFKPKRSHLHFLICNQMVLRIHKDVAAKILVLGLPRTALIP